MWLAEATHNYKKTISIIIKKSLQEDIQAEIQRGNFCKRNENQMLRPTESFYLISHTHYATPDLQFLKLVLYWLILWENLLILILPRDNSFKGLNKLFISYIALSQAIIRKKDNMVIIVVFSQVTL